MQSFETSNSIPFAGKAVTISFYARKGADYSATSSTFNVALISGTGTDQNRVSAGYTGNANPISNSLTLTTSWQKFAFTGTVGATATELATYFFFTPTGTASTNDYFELTGVQIDVGTYTSTTAPTFRRSGGTIEGELAACQRYYYLHAQGTNQAIGMAANTVATEATGSVSFPTKMRTTPTLVSVTGTNFYRFFRNNANDDFNSFLIYLPTTTSALIYNGSEISGTVGQAGYFYANSATASVAFSAEL